MLQFRIWEVSKPLGRIQDSLSWPKLDIHKVVAFRENKMSIYRNGH